ncbi:skin secretory protein xP2 [Diachasma alloeum]|uniref:skin secretory protein xP2 n=1 Tax=Diachasma alloeum TaxID=454923 RepID=UPI0007381D27|nr:skin secretory protein xP2 [Diachasma alloeum]
MAAAAGPPAPAARSRGRRRRPPLQAPIQPNAEHADVAVPEVAPVPATRSRGRPRRVPLEAPIQLNAELADEAAPEAAAAEIPQAPQLVPPEQIAPHPRVAIDEAPVPLRHQEHPRRGTLQAPIQPNAEHVDVAVPAVAPAPATRSRGRPRRVPLEAPIQLNAELADEAVPDMAAAEILPAPQLVPPEQIVPQPQVTAGEAPVPLRRHQEHPRQGTLPAPMRRAAEPVDDALPEEPEPAALGDIAPRDHAVPRGAAMEVEGNEEPPRKKKKTRRGGKQHQCGVCDEKKTLQRLKPCNHRLCVACIKS